MKKSLLMLGLSTCICAASAQNIEHAKLSIHKNNIKVWTFQQQSSPVFVYKAETTFNVPLEKAAALILDVDHAVKWVPYVAVSKFCHAMTKKVSSYCIWCWIFLFH